MTNSMGSTFRNSWLIAIALTGWLLYLLAPVLTPFIAAALLAYIGDQTGVEHGENMCIVEVGRNLDFSEEPVDANRC